MDKYSLVFASVLLGNILYCICDRQVPVSESNGPRNSSTEGESLQSKLIKTLTSTQSSYAFPSRNTENPINVTFSISIRRILEVNERSHTLKTRVWVRQSWINEIFTWNKTEWGNIHELNFPASSVWVPDIVLYNSVAETFPGGTEVYKTPVLALSNGRHSWNSPATLSTSCTINIRYFPFDKQTCYLRFGSWSNDRKLIDMIIDNTSSIGLDFVEGPEWELYNESVQKRVIKFPCCDHPFVDLSFFITIKRKPLYHTLTLIVPCLLILPLTIVSFFLPPDSGERIGLTITILLAVAVFLQITSETLPKYTRNVPYIALFFIAIMATTTISLFVTGFVLFVHFRSSSGHVTVMPRWIKSLFILRIGKLLRVKDSRSRDGQDKANSLLYQNGSVKSTRHADTSNSSNPREETELRKNENLVGKLETSLESMVRGDNLNTELLYAILQHVTKLSSHMQIAGEEDDIAHDWRQLAVVIDRLLLIAFTIAAFAVSTAFLVPIYTH